MKLLALTFAAALTAGLGGAAVEDGKTQWTGYITDSHCGTHGANKSHTAACVDKCVKGGSKAQIRTEGDGKTYDLKEFDPKVRALVGKRVTITGTLDPSGKTITVQGARAADAAP